MERRRCLMGKKGGSVLPSEYQQVEWIQCSGTQYINTQIIADKQTIWELKCAFSNDNASAQNGAGIPSDGARFIFASGSNNTIRLILGTSSDYITIENKQNTIITCELNAVTDSCYINGQFIQNFNNTFTSSIYPIYIFARSEQAAFNKAYICKGQKLYSSKIIKSNRIIQYGIPCYRKSDNVAGMYDIANNVFYTNQGTGEFIVGPDVN